jgi:hypothetical protein
MYRYIALVYVCVCVFLVETFDHLTYFHRHNINIPLLVFRIS